MQVTNSDNIDQLFGPSSVEAEYIWTEIKLKAKPTNNKGALKSQVQRLIKVADKLQKKKEPFVIRCFGLQYIYMYNDQDDTWNIMVSN